MAEQANKHKHPETYETTSGITVCLSVGAEDVGTLLIENPRGDFTCWTLEGPALWRVASALRHARMRAGTGQVISIRAASLVPAEDERDRGRKSKNTARGGRERGRAEEDPPRAAGNETDQSRRLLVREGPRA